MKNVAAVVVTYNRKELLKECVEALLTQTKKDVLDIFIVDNASTDGTKEFIENYIIDEKIKYINTGSNLGGAGGFQFGIKYAVEHDYEFVWVMDDDCIAQPTTLAVFLKVDNELFKNYGFLSSKVLWKDNSICKMNVQRKTMFRNVKNFNKDLVMVVMASFVSLFIPIKVVKEVGLPIKEFFIWTDDWEYTRRISRKYPCYLVNNSMVIHKSKSNIGANIATDVAERLNRYFYLYRNDVYLYKREGIQGLLYELARMIVHSGKIVFYNNDKKLKRFKYLLIGTYSGLSFNPQIEYVEEK